VCVCVCAWFTVKVPAKAKRKFKGSPNFGGLLGLHLHHGGVHRIVLIKAVHGDCLCVVFGSVFDSVVEWGLSWGFRSIFFLWRSLGMLLRWLARVPFSRCGESWELGNSIMVGVNIRQDEDGRGEALSTRRIERATSGPTWS